jgi:putative copper export protein
MDWFGAGGNGPLVVIRAIHFAATAITAGTLVFRALLAKPAWRSDEAVARFFRTQTLDVAWIGLAITVASGVIWLLLQAVSMSGLPLGEAMTSSVLLTVLNQTQFGLVSEIRFVLAVILAGCLTFDRLALPRWLGLLSALGLPQPSHGQATPGRRWAKRQSCIWQPTHCISSLRRPGLEVLSRSPGSWSKLVAIRLVRLLHARRHNAFRLWASPLSARYC